MRKRRTRIGVLAIVACAAGASLAHAELTARGDLFVKFNGGIAPNALPRHARAPISVSVSGTVKTLSGERPPALREIAIAINSGGELNAHGLPICRRSQLEATSSEQARASCGRALVGEGRYLANTAFPEQLAFPANGKILAFNAIVDGREAILAHVYGTKPLPITRIIVFRIRRTGGTYGTTLTGFLPASVNHYGYVRRISLTLHREFVYRGQRRSYLSAACTAPTGFTGGLFSFARASMTFADGRKLSSTLTRSCKVRG
ncbi:MAG: hypothetical protein WD827_04405 [Solirubrobacterales bacterium]